MYRKRDECNHEIAKAESGTSCKEDPTLIQSFRQVISFDARTFSHGLTEENGPGNQSSEKVKLKTPHICD